MVMGGLFCIVWMGDEGLSFTGSVVDIPAGEVKL